jgi:hypothetical protein
MQSYQRELDKVVDYYRRSVFRVDPLNILIRMMYHLSIPLDYSDDVYLRVARLKADSLARAFRFTSAVSFGQYHDPSFYTSETRELYIYISEDINPFTFDAEYKTAAPVKIISHTESNLSLLPPLNSNRSTAEGTNTILIDIPMLALQYKCYARECLINGHTCTYEGFITKIVLPNALVSQFNVAIMNRAKGLYYGYPFTRPLQTLPFPIISYENRVDKLLMYALKAIKNRPIKYSTALEYLPALGVRNQLVAQQLPMFVPTRQLLWAMFISNIDTIMFLIDACGEQAVHYNLEEIQDLKRMVLRFKSDDIFKKMLSTYDYHTLQEQFEQILQLK